MPKKKEPTGTTVAKESKQTTKKPATAATPAVKPPVAEAAKPAEKPAAPAKAEPAPAPTKAAEKPAAPAPVPAPIPKAAEKPAAPAKAEPAPAPTKAAEKPAAPAPVPAPAKAAEKPVPAPAKAAEKPVPAPAKAEKPAAKAEKAAAHPESNVTVIVAKYDVGHGNTMFIRGEGAGLTWEAGIQMENAGNDVWVWTTNEASQGPVSFKFLINDEIWSVGDNMIAPVGETTTLYPSF